MLLLLLFRGVELLAASGLGHRSNLAIVCIILVDGLQLYLMTNAFSVFLLFTSLLFVDLRQI